VKSDASTRQARLRDVDAELSRIARLRTRVGELAPDVAAAGTSSGSGA
jgi:hypothetical protein